jgi:hypothetical protein
MTATQLLRIQRAPKRLATTVNYAIHEYLVKRSTEEGRSVSNLCAFILECEASRNPIPKRAIG